MIYTYGGDYNDYDPSDNNFNCNGFINPDRIPTPRLTRLLLPELLRSLRPTGA